MENKDCTLLNFSNPGEIDIRLVTTMGVNVGSEAAIGQFGTGLKYAIAGTLRLGGKIVIWSGATRLDFLCVPQTIKGKKFQFIEMIVDEEHRGEAHMRAHILGFTTELGKHWEPWMLYRELFANSRDAGGGGIAETLRNVGLDDDLGSPGETNVMIACKELWAVHEARDEFFIAQSEKTLWSGHGVEIYEAPEGLGGIFYQGIQVALAESAVFRYNLTEKIELTEDRTIKDVYACWSTVAKALLQCENEEILRAVLLIGTREAELDFNWYSIAAPSQEFIRASLRVVRELENSSLESMLKYRVPERLRQARLAIPESGASWEEIRAAAPERQDETPSWPDFYSYAQEMEQLLKLAVKRGDYWEQVATRAQAQSEEASPESPETNEDLEPF